MTIASFFAVIGLPPGASLEEIRRAYRRLALHYHPDHNSGDREAHRRFVAVTRAYKVLLDYYQAEPAKRPGQCAACGAIVRLYPDTDGRDCCANCLLGKTGRKVLPHPMVRLVRFYGVITLWTGGLALTITGAVAESRFCLAAALACTAAGMAWLAAATIWIRHCYDPRLPISTQQPSRPRAVGGRANAA